MLGLKVKLKRVCDFTPASQTESIKAMKSKATNQDIIKEFQKAVAVLQVIDKGPFRVRAYQKAIDIINELEQELSIISRSQSLTDIPGIGKELAAKITQLIETGSSPALEKLFSQVPQGMFSLLDIPKIGARKAFKISSFLELEDEHTAIQQLKHALNTGKLENLEGFKEKSIQQLQQNINRIKPKFNRLLLSQAESIAHTVIEKLKTIPQVEKTSTLGSIRRRKDTVGDIDIALSTSDPHSIAATLKQWELCDQIVASGEDLIRIQLTNGTQVDIKMCPPQQWGSMLQHFTGSKQHNIALRERAIKQNKSLSEQGIKIKGIWQRYQTEREVYQEIGLQYIPPEMRENNGEIELSERAKLPKLIQVADIKGELHTHTDYPWKSSHDYGCKVSQLLDAVSQTDLEWIAIGDHNPSKSGYAAREYVKIVQERNKYIEQHHYSWLEEHPDRIIKVFKTLEVDINADGTLATPQEALEYLDFVIAAVHSNLELGPEKQTQRVLTAIQNPLVKIIAHPSGRLIAKRQPMGIYWDEVFAACKKHTCALEINGAATRKDLPDALVQKAIKQGVVLSLGSDIHSPEHITNLNNAIDVARRGWARPSDIINTQSYADVSAWLTAR